MGIAGIEFKNGLRIFLVADRADNKLSMSMLLQGVFAAKSQKMSDDGEIARIIMQAWLQDCGNIDHGYGMLPYCPDHDYIPVYDIEKDTITIKGNGLLTIETMSVYDALDRVM